MYKPSPEQGMVYIIRLSVKEFQKNLRNSITSIYFKKIYKIRNPVMKLLVKKCCAFRNPVTKLLVKKCCAFCNPVLNNNTNI